MSLRDTIGGHSREALIWALTYARDARRIETFVQYPPWGDCMRAEYLAARDILSPAKLAELMASALQPFAPVLVIKDGVAPSREPRFDEFVIRWDREHGGTIQVYPPRPKGDDYAPLWVMEQARAALLHILELPESATSTDALREVETK